MRQFMGRIGASLFLVFALRTSAFAGGGEVGNGGDVFQCQNSKNVLVDVYEAQAQRGITLDLGGPRLDLFSKIDLAIKRLERLSAARAKVYHDQAHNFFNEAALIPGAQLTPVPDVYNWVTPNGCVLKQIAIQHAPEFPQDKRYLVSKDLWDTLDDDSKAALILHEVIYREGISLGFTNSIAVRYFNSLLFSHQLDQATAQDFVPILQSLPFQAYQVGDVLLPVGTVQNGAMTNPTSFVYDEKGNIVQASPDAIVLPSGLEIFASNDGGNYDVTQGAFTVYFSADGKLLEVKDGSFYPGPTSGDIYFANDQWTSIQNAVYWMGTTPLRLQLPELLARDLDAQGMFTQDQLVQFARYTGGPATFKAEVPNGNMVARFSDSGEFFDIVGTDAPISLRTPDMSTGTFGPIDNSVKKLTFYRAGYVAKMDTLANDFEITGGGMTFKAGTSIEFWPTLSAVVKVGTLGADAVLFIDQNKNTRKFKAGTTVHFDQNWIVTSVGSR
jgi:hypothetical protein